MIESYACVSLYIKRVLREVHHDENDLFITKKLVSIITGRILAASGGDESERAVKDALRAVGSPASLGRELRRDYKHNENGFMLFNRTMTNLASAAIILVAEFVVFRLYPQTEYVAYICSAVAAIFAAWLGTHCFYKLRYHIIAMALPSFLLIYYPVRDALRLQASSGVPFFRSLFSYSNHIVLFLIVLTSAAYALTTALLHISIYSEHKRALKFSLCGGLIAAALASFAFYAASLNIDYNQKSASYYSALSSEYREYYSGIAAGGWLKPGESLISSAKLADELIDRYNDIYVPSDKQTSGSLSSLLNAFSVYAESPDALMEYYHAGFSGDDTDFDYAALSDLMRSAALKVKNTIASIGDAPTLKQLMKIESSCSAIYSDFNENLEKIYDEYIFRRAE